MHAQTGVEPWLRRQPAEQGKPKQTQREHGNNAFDDVLVLEVSQFVRQDRIDFVCGQTRQQRVIKDHAFACTKAREVSIGVRAALAAIHDKKTLRSKAATLHQGGHAGLDGFIFERGELVEQGGDKRGVDQQ